jgi:hypothetical protein
LAEGLRHRIVTQCDKRALHSAARAQTLPPLPALPLHQWSPLSYK